MANGEFADGQHQFGLQQRELTLQPGGAFGYLLRRRHTVAAFPPFARKTTADGGKIDPVAHLVLAPAKRTVKPLEQRLARGPCERPAQLGLLVPRGLPDEHHATDDRAADDGGPVHKRTALARAQRGKVSINRGNRRHRTASVPQGLNLRQASAPMTLE